MARYLFILFLFLGNFSHAQVLPEMSPSRDSTFIRVDEMPAFIGGNDAMMEYLRTHIKYPEEAEKEKIEGRVLVTFVIDKTGKVKDPRVKRSLDPTLDKEAMRVIKEMPDWKPGKQNGVPVKVQMALPIMFKLTNE